MRVLCFGSMNIDYTYRVSHFVGKGETLAADSLELFAGGKGMNQAVALSRAGASAFQAGAVGEDGRFLLDELGAAGVDTGFVEILKTERTGNAVIQNDRAGDNCILLYGGANRAITEAMADRVLQNFGEGDFLVLQNEISALPYIMDKAHERGMRIYFNPSPMDGTIQELPLELVDCFLLNEVEAAQLLGQEPGSGLSGEALLSVLTERFGEAEIVLTLGEKGAMYGRGGMRIFQPAFPVRAVDTTAAGDTFTGFFISGCLRGMSAEKSMELAACASSIAVTRRGAFPSIPDIAEVRERLGWEREA